MAARPFIDLTWRGQVRRLSVVARRALESFGLRTERLSCQGHAENATFRADLTRDLRSRSRAHDSRRVLVRVHRPDYQSATAIRSELAWLDALGTHQRLAVPAPLRTREGESVVSVDAPGLPQPRLVSVLRWLPGPILMQRPRGRDDERLIGETVGLLHEQARSWTRPKGFRRRRRNARGLLGDRSEFGSADAALARAPKRLRPLLERGFERGAQAIEDAERELGRLLLIHGDLHAGNLIRHRERLAVIDFDDCGVGSAALDVAVALEDSRYREDWPERRAAFVDGHERVGSLDPAVLDALDGLLMARTAEFLLWASSRALDNPRFAVNLPSWTDEIAGRFRQLGC